MATGLSHNSEPSTSASLLQRAREGDSECWTKIAQLYGPIIYAWARRSGCQSADAADVMQETLTAVAKTLASFDHQRSGATFRGWLWTIARNKLRDQGRVKDPPGIGGTDAQIELNQVSEIPRDSPPSEAGSDNRSIRRRTIEMLRDQFDPRSWQMFWESTVMGRDPVDVAQDMGVSKWAVYKARARVLHRLQKETDGLIGPE